MSEKDIRLNRRQALAVLGVTGTGALTCSLPFWKAIETTGSPRVGEISYGETNNLTYFTFSHQLPKYRVQVIEPVIREVAVGFGLPLTDASKLKINLLSRERYPETKGAIMSIEGALEVNPGEINISGGYILEKSRDDDKQFEQLLMSLTASMALFEGLCLSAAKRGEIGVGTATSMAYNYNYLAFRSIQSPEQKLVIKLFDEAL